MFYRCFQMFSGYSQLLTDMDIFRYVQDVLRCSKMFSDVYRCSQMFSLSLAGLVGLVGLMSLVGLVGLVNPIGWVGLGGQ